jgi:hypothetical protein
MGFHFPLRNIKEIRSMHQLFSASNMKRFLAMCSIDATCLDVCKWFAPRVAMGMLFFVLIGSFSASCSISDAAEIDSFLSEDDSLSVNVYARLQKLAYAALDQRLERVERLKDVESIQIEQERLREQMIGRLGGFPDKTPLHSSVVGVIQANGYRIEKVIFDSRPHHRITANFYVPNDASSNKRVPGIAVSSGHSRTAKTAEYNQRFGAMFASHGMAALVFDPIGQGERSQILGEDGEVSYGGTTTEHMLIGVGATLVGKNTATYRIWDGMRALDYLASREEINPDKLGYTGCSGGGTLTSYVMALDPRVRCAAPACYLTTFRRLIETIGPQDAEQNLYSQIIDGIDQPDYVFMRAPLPTLISSTTQDFFNIDGSWENFRQSKQIYGRLGYPERVDLVEIEGPHGVQPEGLATITHWMKRWLCGVDQPVEPIELKIQESSSLLCTSTGQVLTSFADELSVVDLNSEFSEKLAKQRSLSWGNLSDLEKLAVVQSTAKATLPEENVAKFISKGLFDSPSGEAMCGVLMTDSCRIPCAVIRLGRTTSRWSIILHDEGINGAARLTEVVEQRLKAGRHVVLLDLSGQGRTTTAKPDATLSDWKTFYLAYLLGDSLVGLQTQDLLTVARFLESEVVKQKNETASDFSIELVASGQSVIPALHAGVIGGGQRFERLTLSDLPPSWSEMVQVKAPVGMLGSAVHGVLDSYDWPDLLDLIGEDRLQIRKE